MEQNELISQITSNIKQEILKNKSLLEGIVSEMIFNPNFILNIMSQMNASSTPKQPVSNLPKVKSKSENVLEKPIVIAQGNQESQIISDLLEGNNVYIMGKAGTGKSYLATALPPIMGQPMFVINCSQWTSPIEIRGGQTIEGYIEGELIKAWEQGGILILDELPKLDPNTAGLLNDALSQTAAQPKYDEKGKVITNTIPKITNGNGKVIFKGQDAKNEEIKYRFGVIATGNTNMMDVGNKYSGNQRQDYSLVDRFAGSIYTLDTNDAYERKQIYPYVFNVCNAMRTFCNEKDTLQSVSLRTMLNFNRTYEQEMLYKIGSPFADTVYDNNDNIVRPKSVQTSIDSFLGMMEPNMRAKLEADRDFSDNRNNLVSDAEFIIQFKQRYHIDPFTKESLTEKEIEQLASEIYKLQFLGQ